MKKRCKPNTICFETFTFIILILITCVMLYVVYKFNEKVIINNTTKNTTIPESVKINNPIMINRENIYENPDDVLLNPYTSPLKNNFYRNRQPLTNKQLGILKNESMGSMILPLFGKPLRTNRDKWNYYTMTNNNIKLPVLYKNKNCTGEYGCDEIMNGDNVYVQGYDSLFSVLIYEHDNFQYNPNI
jgi:hypothetical protein